jgi:hypothetical protein
MRFKEIASRLTGFSTPIFGVSWQPPDSSIAVARDVLAYLEDRRVLYEPSAFEVPGHCIESVLEIRRFLTDHLRRASDDELAGNLRGMRAACRKFLTDTRRLHVNLSRPLTPGHFQASVFEIALGELRGVFGLHIAQTAVKYGLDVEDQLARTLPIADEDSEDDDE